MKEMFGVYDSLSEDDPKIKKLRAESKAEGKAEALQTAIVVVVESRFPTLLELAKKQVKLISSPDVLELIHRQVVRCPDEATVHHILKYSVF